MEEEWGDEGRRVGREVTQEFGSGRLSRGACLVLDAALQCSVQLPRIELEQSFTRISWNHVRAEVVIVHWCVEEAGTFRFSCHR